MQLWWWKKFAWLPSEWYLTLCYLSLTCSSLNSLWASLDVCQLKVAWVHLLTVWGVLKRQKHGAKYGNISLTLPTVRASPRTPQGLSVNDAFNPTRLSCSVTVCHRETTLTLAAGSEQAKRSCTHRRAAPLSHKVHQTLILIKREKVLFLRAGYRSTFLVSVYRATLVCKYSGKWQYSESESEMKGLRF